MRAKDRDRFARLHDERLVVVEVSQRVDDGVERRPAARGATRAAIDNQIVRPLGDLRVEIVHQHPECGLLRPSLAGERGPTRGTNVAADDVHRLWVRIFERASQLP